MRERLRSRGPPLRSWLARALSGPSSGARPPAPGAAISARSRRRNVSNESEQTAGEESFSESVLGKGFFQQARVKKLLTYPADFRVTALAAIFAFLLFVPYLGAVGLWDPWETHYGEVAREMIQRNDYVHPFWENAWFFSKPVLTMWMQAFGMQLVGTMRTEGALALMTEWGFRLPTTLFSIAATALLALAVCRVVSRRAGLAVAFVLCTMPLYFLVSRQSVTDTPFISALVCAMACAAIAQLDKTTRHRTAWWYAFYVFCAVGTLAKGLLGFGIPAAVLVSYAIFCVIPLGEKSFEEHASWFFKHALLPTFAAGGAAVVVAAGLMGLYWNDSGDAGKAKAFMPALLVALATFAVVHRLTDKQRAADIKPVPPFFAQLYRMKLCTGILVFLAIAMPWYQYMFTFESVDDESKLFWYRFVVHDHFARLGSGVHTTTPGGSFTYFIEQGGYAIFPWVALVPGAIAVAARLRVRSEDPAEHAGMLAVIWLALTFAIMGASATKFHHYVLPMLPPLAVLIALFIDRLWTEGIAKHAVSLLAGVPLFALVGKDLAFNPKNFTDLFVYNYDRPYPFELVQRPISLLGMRSLWAGDLVAVTLLGVGGYLMFDAFSGKGRSVFSRAAALLLTCLGGAVLVVTATRGQVSPTTFFGLALLLVVLYVGYEATRPQREQKAGLYITGALLGVIALSLLVKGVRTPAAQDSLLKPLTEAVILRSGQQGSTGLLGFAFLLGGALCAVAALMKARTLLFGSFWAFACAFALWFNWSHWVDLSHQWTQRDLFWRYYKHRKPGEPITSFLMNWRGETFYSRNTVKQIKDNNLLRQYADQPGREWALVEHYRLGVLKSAVGTDKTVTLVDRDINNKFVLVTVD
ncbi:MAG: glycosyltransferase family 39 protein [Myxococcales bacterium]|nr:glycosyltransferase family 39 protein [Myxococcales bacterium]